MLFQLIKNYFYGQYVNILMIIYYNQLSNEEYEISSTFKENINYSEAEILILDSSFYFKYIFCFSEEDLGLFQNRYLIIIMLLIVNVCNIIFKNIYCFIALLLFGIICFNKYIQSYRLYQLNSSIMGLEVNNFFIFIRIFIFFKEISDIFQVTF